MKKLLILVVLIAALAVAGCVEEEINAATNAVQAVPNQTEEKDNGIPLNEVEDDTWGIQLTATKVTPTGMTLVCKQSGGGPTGELQTGSYLILEESINEQWLPVEMTPSEYERAWTDEAWIIPMNDTVEWEVDWEWVYGELPEGNYRIGKEIMDFRSAGNYDEKMYYANFEVTN
ncbi:immunoglobulin-like domain-containing protein [uncultured Methanolobus sp.]|uniref:immunoglobulin-like domain-containing protein n=1 Tax=uncultured Methanolobus sp. TaxID=218300 RepID=UPI002AAC3208|nr:immunoglobulin-like domain-containing protein [uncultured Methanolobus sp.]